jgi:hypothetical protein
VWDGLPAHRSKLMRAWLHRQRSWLVVEPLSAYAPDLNPVEGLWASLKGVELANLAGDTSTRSSRRPSVASSASAAPTGWRSRSCATAACPCGERGLATFLVLGSSPGPGASSHSQHPDEHRP